MGSTRPPIGVLAAVYLSIAVLGAVENLVGSGLPILQREIGLSVTDAALATSIFGLAALVALPIGGKLGDLYGPKPVVASCLGAAAVGAALSAIADSLLVVLVAKILLGLGAAAIAPAVSLIRQVAADRSTVAMGWFIGAITLGGSAGALLSGPLADAFSRFAVFMVPATLQVVALLLLLVAVPGRPADQSTRQRLDVLGLAAFTIALLTFQGMVTLSSTSGWASFPVLGLGVASISAVVAFIIVERRVTDPFVDLKLLSNRALRGSVLLGLVVGVAYFSGYFLLQQVVVLPVTDDGPGLGLTYTEISLYTAPGIILGIFTAPLAGWLMRLLGMRSIAAGGLVALVTGSVLFGVLHSEPWHIIVASILVIGIGGAVLYTVAMAGGEEAVAADEVGISSAMVMTARTVGGVAGPIVLAVALSVGSKADGLPTDTGFLLAIGVTAAIGCLGFFCIRLLWGRDTSAASDIHERVA